MKNKLLLLTAITFSGTLLSSCSLFNTINYLNLDDYVLEDKIIEYQNIYFQKSNLGYIAISLVDKNVEVVEVPSRIYEEDGEYIHQHEIYAFGENFISNNEYIKEIHLNTYNTVAYKNAIYNVPNLEHFYIESPMTDNFSLLVERGAFNINVSKIEVRGGSFFIACRYFPEDLYKLYLLNDFKIRLNCNFTINHEERYIQNYVCHPRFKFALFKKDQGKSYGNHVLEGQSSSTDSTFKIATINGYVDYYVLGEGQNECLKNKNYNDIYVTLTMAFNVRYEERHNAQIDVVKRHDITSDYATQKGIIPSGKVQKDSVTMKVSTQFLD